jgi:hypothetical protein
MIYLFDNGFGAGIVFTEKYLTPEQREHAVKVENIPEPEVIEGKTAILRCDHKTKEVWYDYIDIEETEIIQNQQGDTHEENSSEHIVEDTIEKVDNE